MVSKEELENLMGYCYGTEGYHRYAIIPNCSILLTDGVKCFADNADDTSSSSVNSLPSLSVPSKESTILSSKSVLYNAMPALPA